MKYSPLTKKHVTPWLQSHSKNAVYQTIKSLLNSPKPSGEILELSLFQLQSARAARQSSIHFEHCLSQPNSLLLNGDRQWDHILFVLSWQFFEHDCQQHLLEHLHKVTSDKGQCTLVLFNPFYLTFFDLDDQFDWLHKSYRIGLPEYYSHLKQQGFEHFKLRSLYPRQSRISNWFQLYFDQEQAMMPWFERFAGPIFSFTVSKRPLKPTWSGLISPAAVSNKPAAANLAKQPLADQTRLEQQSSKQSS